MDIGYPAEQFGQGQRLKADDQFFGKATALAPDIDFPNALGVGSTQGGLAIVLSADEVTTIANAETITLSLYTSETETGTYALYPVSFSIETTSSTSFGIGDSIMEIITPNLPNVYTKVSLTSDTTATNKVSCWLRYIAR